MPRTSATLEEVHEIADPATGLSGVIAIHSLKLGAAAGGCRFWRYDDARSLRADAVRLAEGMAYKNALAGLPFGGGKAVLEVPPGNFDREGLFEAFGRAVDALDGAYVTAEDVGTTEQDMQAVARFTRHVAGLPSRDDESGGDPSPWTAYGVFLAMQVSVERRLRRSLEDTTVAVQGLGNVGFALCTLLHEAGAKLIVSDPRAERVERAVGEFGATPMAPQALMATPVDAFAPCALGGILDKASIAKLQTKVVCGGANNQLSTPADGIRLMDRSILYAPDYLVNAGGIISVAAEYLHWPRSELTARIAQIPERLGQLFDLCEERRQPTNVVADMLAKDIIAGERGSASWEMAR